MYFSKHGEKIYMNLQNGSEAAILAASLAPKSLAQWAWEQARWFRNEPHLPNQVAEREKIVDADEIKQIMDALRSFAVMAYQGVRDQNRLSVEKAGTLLDTISKEVGVSTIALAYRDAAVIAAALYNADVALYDWIWERLSQRGDLDTNTAAEIANRRTKPQERETILAGLYSVGITAIKMMEAYDVIRPGGMCIG